MTVGHGTTTKYRYGCRCDLCRAAKREQKQRWWDGLTLKERREHNAKFFKDKTTAERKEYGKSTYQRQVARENERRMQREQDALRRAARITKLYKT